MAISRAFNNDNRHHAATLSRQRMADPNPSPRIIAVAIAKLTRARMQDGRAVPNLNDPGYMEIMTDDVWSELLSVVSDSELYELRIVAAASVVGEGY